MKNNSLAIGFLDWKGKRTTKNSVNSYVLHGLMSECDQSIYFGQEGGTLSDNETLAFGFTDRVESDRNIGIANALIQMLEICTSEYFIFLENDWELLTSKELTPKILADAKSELTKVQCVRLRSRMHPGEPLHSRQFGGREMDSPKHLLDCVHWHLNPDKTFEQIRKEGEYYITSCKFANYTNNPCLYKTKFLKETIVPKLTSGSNVEDDLNGWWPDQWWEVAAGPGMFTHNRLD